MRMPRRSMRWRWSGRARIFWISAENPRGRARRKFRRRRNSLASAPVLERLRGKLKIPISIDTQKAIVAERAIAAGAEIINDISGLSTDPALADVARRHRLPMILMHMRGKPRTMQKGPFARDVMRDVLRGLRAAAARARKAGIAKSQIVLDPGIGFGKNYAQNCELLARLA